MYTVNQLESRLVQEKIVSQITRENPLFIVGTTLGQSMEISIDKILLPVTVTVEHPSAPVPVSNPEMRVVTAFDMTLDNYASPETLELRVPIPADDPAAGIYIRSGDVWVNLDGKRIGNKIVVKLSPDAIDKYFIKQGTEYVGLLAVLSIVGQQAVADKLIKEFDGGGTTAVIFVQGITVSRISVKKFVHEYEAADDGSKVYSYYYNPTQPLAGIAKDLAEEASSTLLKDGVSELYLVPYSFGGLVAQDALRYSKDNGLALATLTKKVVYIGTPFGGSPLLGAWNNFFAYLLNTRIPAGLFNLPSMHPEIVDLLVKGKQESAPSIDAEYGLVIGTKTYPWVERFFKGFFKTTNDGVVQVPDAYPAWYVERKYCDPNILFVHVTHDQLPGVWPVRDFVYKIINKEKSEENPLDAVLGYSQSVDISHKQCKSGDVIVVVGKRLPDKERPHPCSCGDGVCGIDENIKTCPEDCANVVQKFNSCLYLPWIINALLLILLIVSGIYIYRKEKTHERGKGFLVLMVMVAIVFLMILAFYLECGFLLALALLLVVIIIIMILSALVHFRKPKPLMDLDDALKKLKRRFKR